MQHCFARIRAAAAIFFTLCIVAVPLRAAAPQSAPLSLDESLLIATRDAPQLAAQNASLRAARESDIAAGELPDPKLFVGIDNLPADGTDRFNLTRDGMTMRKIGVMQEFTGGDKLRIRRERADAEVRREEAMLVFTRTSVKRETALAWIERHFAERQVALLAELADEAGLQSAAAQAALAGGRGQAADPYTARIAAQQVAERRIDSERMLARTRAGLARWIGNAAGRSLGDPPAFDRLPHRHESLVSGLDDHPHLAMNAPIVAIAESEARLAARASRPDWSLELGWAQRGPAYSNMVSIGVRIDLPILQSHRQDPQIRAKLAQVEQARAQAEDAKRAHEAEINATLADWEAAKQRVQLSAASLVPLARERSAATLAAYRGGRGELTAVVEGRKGEIEARIAQLQAEADLARAWAYLNFLIPGSNEKTE